MWSHKAYKGKWPLRLLLAYLQTLAGQNSIYEWVRYVNDGYVLEYYFKYKSYIRDHRVHHKFSDTDADPHNINRGFFFSHMGWLTMEKHPEVKRRGATVDMSDLEKDWVVMLQKKYGSYI
jgi:stearoyl-CoA desaturase (delta-9 desaturase)